MGLLTDLASSLDSMMRSLGDSPNFLCVLIIFAIVYAVAFIVAAIPAAILALLNLTADKLHPRKDTWLSFDEFAVVANVLFALLITPVIIGLAAAVGHGHVLSSLLLGLDFAAGIYHGVFVGRSITEHRRLPHFWDLVDEVIPM